MFQLFFSDVCYVESGEVFVNLMCSPLNYCLDMRFRTNVLIKRLYNNPEDNFKVTVLVYVRWP